MKNNKAPHYLKNLINSDQDFVTIVENLIANDTQEQAQLDKKDYQTAIISACIGTGGLDLFKKVVADAIKDTVVKFASFDDVQVKRSRSNADKLSKKALWSKFITYYDDAYDFALRKAELRK